MERLYNNKRALRWLLSVSAKYNIPSLAARVLAKITAPLMQHIDAQAHRDRAPILVLNSGKEDFYRDLLEIFRDDSTFSLVKWPHFALQAIAQAILHPSLRHDSYLSNDIEIERTKSRYREFLIPMWRHYRTLCPVSGALSANFGYLAQRELAFALEMQGTPFLVLQKENLNAATEERKRVWHSIYRNNRGKFGGRKILVYNQLERELEIASGVASPNQVEVVGMPRLDRFHRWRLDHSRQRPAAESSQVLLFSFSATEKIPYGLADQLNWGAFRAQTHKALVKAALACPRATMTIKTKGSADTVILQLLDCERESLPANLRIVSGGDPFELIASSNTVVGFNTSGLLEALALGKKVIVPRFGEATNPDLSKFVLDLGNAVVYARSPDHLVELICTHASAAATTPEPLSSEIAYILEYWVGNADGEAGRRAYAAICRELSRETHATSSP